GRGRAGRQPQGGRRGFPPADLRADGQRRQRRRWRPAAPAGGHAGAAGARAGAGFQHHPVPAPDRPGGGKPMRYPVIMALVVALFLGLMGGTYVVREGQVAIVLNLGRVDRTDIGPGLHFKWPLIERALVFDRRLQVLDAEPERYLTSERKD